MNISPAQFCVYRGIDGEVISLGKRQIEWLVEHNHCQEAGRTPDNWLVFVGSYTVPEINAIVLSEHSLRECDFCNSAPAGWEIPTGAFTLDLGPNHGAQLGGPYRPVFACSECVPFLSRGAQTGLIRHAVEAQIARTRQLGLLARHVSRKQARDAIWPMIAEVVGKTLRNQTGPPEES